LAEKKFVSSTGFDKIETSFRGKDFQNIVDQLKAHLKSLGISIASFKEKAVTIHNSVGARTEGEFYHSSLEYDVHCARVKSAFLSVADSLVRGQKPQGVDKAIFVSKFIVFRNWEVYATRWGKLKQEDSDYYRNCLNQLAEASGLLDELERLKNLPLDS